MEKATMYTRPRAAIAGLELDVEAFWRSFPS
jgi:hypothetical protein